MQSIGNLLEEISSLRKSVERLPDLLQSSIQPALKPNIQPVDNEPIIAEINGVSERIDTLTQGIKAFFETYAENHEATSIHETLRPSVDSEALTGIEGLIRAEGKSHSTGLAELSREISALVEENNTALLHEVREIISEAENDSGNEHETSSHSPSHTKMLKLTVLLSASSIILLIINIIIFLFNIRY